MKFVLTDEQHDYVERVARGELVPCSPFREIPQVRMAIMVRLIEQMQFGIVLWPKPFAVVWTPPWGACYARSVPKRIANQMSREADFQAYAGTSFDLKQVRHIQSIPPEFGSRPSLRLNGVGLMQLKAFGLKPDDIIDRKSPSYVAVREFMELEVRHILNDILPRADLAYFVNQELARHSPFWNHFKALGQAPAR